jgi:micrococcal nuclease
MRQLLSQLRSGFALGLLLLVSSMGSAQAVSFSGTVTKVSDGDTLWVRPATGGKPLRLRIKGVDAPERCQPWGPEASRALQAKLMGQTVQVDAPGRDDHKRLLANVAFQGRDVGAWLVTNGHAWSYRFKRDPGPYVREEATARSQRAGLFAQAHAERPRDFRKRHGPCKD